MNHQKLLIVGKLLYKIGTALMSLLLLFINTFLDLFVSNEKFAINQTEDYVTGEYNYRTRKFDVGADPDGWYDEDL